MGTILASLTAVVDVNCLVVEAKTSCLAWCKLASAYEGPARSDLMRIRERLLEPQANRSLLDYLQGIRSASNEFVLLSPPLPNDELIAYIRNGLSTDLKGILVQHDPNQSTLWRMILMLRFLIKFHVLCMQYSVH